ncbi:MAG: NUDIX domain-containing protein [Bacteroidetes bacterium]|nr:NUDIX domain-containing protein [Bacteroidota bacterium]
MTVENIRHFVVRVYGLIINDKKEVLLTDEYQLGMKMTKFPGGGLEFGEGPVDCIKREAYEEFGQEVKVIDHFYTTDFFQKALFYKKHQIISIYYLLEFEDRIRFKISNKSFDFPELKEGNQSFRWKAIKDLIEDDVSFPIDKVVVKLLKERIVQTRVT